MLQLLDRNKRTNLLCAAKNVTLKYNFAFGLVFYDYSRLVTLYKIGEVHFRLLGTNGFHVKPENERFMQLSFASTWVDPRDTPRQPTGTQRECYSFDISFFPVGERSCLSLKNDYG